jgi:hypothetical protein
VEVLFCFSTSPSLSSFISTDANFIGAVCDQGAMTKAYGAWLSLKAIVDVQEIHSRDKVVMMQRGQHWG